MSRIADATNSAQQWLAAWGEEVARADIAAGRVRFDPDLSAFGTHADVVHGRDDVEEQQWSKIWPAIEDFRFDVDASEVIVSPDGRLAVVVAPWSSTGIGTDGEPFPRPGRATIVLRREGESAEWFGVHTHFSLARGVPSSTHGHKPSIR
jgi:ketosteroid isomerase-like protein